MNYPNEYWKYVTSVYYYTNRVNENFKDDFEIFLKQLIAFLFAKFIEQPTVNAIKDDIYSACISISYGNGLGLYYNFSQAYLANRYETFSSSKISKGLLLLDAYLHPDQKDYIKRSWNWTYISRKWQSTNYFGWKEEDARDYLDKFGNKIVFEKKLNIQAGNGYFKRKQDKYRSSEISVVRDLANYQNNDWTKDDIEKREAILKDRLIDFSIVL